ncbi:HAD-IB family phosphatase [Patescibacteria group bacterium]|nr:HAD-IB family phosphatase [Patescibacteria group bacterium]
MIKAVIFDIDGTLVKGNSWIAITEAMGASVDDHRQFYRDMLDGDGDDYEDSKHKLLDMWARTEKDNKEFFTSLYDDIPLADGAKEIIGCLEERKIVPCLITGSTDLFAEIVARKLGIDCYFANATLVWDKDGKLVDFEYFKNQAVKKLEQFEKFCDERDLRPEECIAVGDSVNDISLFETMRGIALKSPDSEELEKTAWKTVNSLSELKTIL